MSKWKELAQKSTEWIPVLFVAVVYFLYHLYMKAGIGDDAVFLTTSDYMTLPEFWVSLYETFTPRFLINSFEYSLPHAWWVWSVLNYAITLGLFIILLKWTKRSGQTDGLIVTALFLTYPIANMKEAGWMSTTVNYWWILFAVLVALLPLYKSVMDLERRWYHYLFAVLGLLYATDHEQGALILLLYLLAYGVWLFLQRTVPDGYVIVAFVWTVFRLILASVAPGIVHRNELSISLYMPNFSGFGPGEKIYLGLLHMTKVFLMGHNWVTFAFALLLFLCVLGKFGYKIRTYIAFMPFLISFIYMFQSILEEVFPWLYDFFYTCESVGTVEWHRPSTYFPMFILGLFIASSLYSLWFLLEENKKGRTLVILTY
ncbi:MAG: hypothetical protein K5682_10890, partial [Lachnospiraceae bacterium]|nr:hypothetical protein [Lachnospiraceae bacterium]